MRLIRIKGKLLKNIRESNFDEALKNIKNLKDECESDFTLVEEEVMISIKMKDFVKAKKIFKNNEYNLKLYQEDQYHYLNALMEKYNNQRTLMF